MLGISFRSVFKFSSIFLTSLARNESRVLHTLVNNKAENASNTKPPYRPKSVCDCQCRDFHLNDVVSGKYHDLVKRRAKVKKRMTMLRSRLERLDKEDRPTGCILCPMRDDITIDYKNVRLLSQFVSPHTGRIYGRAVTGLCRKKQIEVTKAIKRAQTLGYMPITMKYFEFHNDPAIF